MQILTASHHGNSSPTPVLYMGDCQNYGPLLGPLYNTGPNIGDPKRDHNFDNPPHVYVFTGSA